MSEGLSSSVPHAHHKPLEAAPGAGLGLGYFLRRVG